MGGDSVSGFAVPRNPKKFPGGSGSRPCIPPFPRKNPRTMGGPLSGLLKVPSRHGDVPTPVKSLSSSRLRSRSRASSSPASEKVALTSPAIVAAAHAPSWMIIPSIVKGYRVRHSCCDAVRSLFSLHSDTLNVWTHALGLAWFIVEAPRMYEQLLSNGSTPLDIASFSFFLACAVFQMGSSAMYHLFRCVGPELEATFLRIDIYGILSMIAGCWVLAISQGFACFPGYAAMYLAVEVALLAGSLVLGTWAVSSPNLYPAYYVVVWMSVAFGLVPCMHHYLFICSTTECWSRLWTAQVGMFGNYAVGFFLFLLRFPERAMPGVFDVVGQSHTLWHVFVFLAGRAWMLGMLSANDLKASQGHTCP